MGVGDIIDESLPGFEVELSCEEVEEGGFAFAGFAGNGDMIAARYFEVRDEGFELGVFFVVGEGDVFEDELFPVSWIPFMIRRRLIYINFIL